ncbi:O-antigen ligase family protein [Candidatus Hydrogenosomobacter endosymbioticus]|uniref:O-antigen ligase-related domain-containing protein n=1 Tax=Candidatus Hydrogenosomobacter endosymbioticus TaxID=2558174 RepID=A0ABM7V9J4_9PROT|nr:O-antigen ligase family protein [Candidatus Hydrogenosomobacter endosymbioticus]BDB96452.1 hypothetical protein HYD_5850 [Candidatus Hydrogenosomobacter endosymbioticus]
MFHVKQFKTNISLDKVFWTGIFLGLMAFFFFSRACIVVCFAALSVFIWYKLPKLRGEKKFFGTENGSKALLVFNFLMAYLLVRSAVGAEYIVSKKPIIYSVIIVWAIVLLIYFQQKTEICNCEKFFKKIELATVLVLAGCLVTIVVFVFRFDVFVKFRQISSIKFFYKMIFIKIFPFMVLALALLYNQRKMVSFWIICAIMALISCLTSSYSMFIAFALSITAFVLYVKYSRPVAFCAKLIVSSYVLLLPFVLKYIKSATLSSFNRNDEVHKVLHTLYERFLIWDEVVAQLKEAIFFGMGIGQERWVAANMIIPEYHGFSPLFMHNAALQIWVEFGFVGAALSSCAAYLYLDRIVRGNSIIQNGFDLAIFLYFMVMVQSFLNIWQPWLFCYIGTLLIMKKYAFCSLKSDVSRETFKCSNGVL